MTLHLSSWDLARRAAEGSGDARETFSRRYLPVVRAYLVARWRGTRWLGEVEDAIQDVFYDCFREDGALARGDGGRARFRAFLYGVARTAALRAEERGAREQARRPTSTYHISQLAEESDLAAAFDRAWAQSVMDEAGEWMAKRARVSGGEAPRRVELLRLRFDEGLPIRRIAELWSEDAARLHRMYRRARDDFRAALVDVVAGRDRLDRVAAERECEQLLDLLQEE